MLIVRETFSAKPGQAGKMAKLMKKAFANEPSTRVLTDFIGNYNTVVMEMQVESLADFEKQYNDYKTGKIQMDPALAEEMKGYTELWSAGKREVFQVIE